MVSRDWICPAVCVRRARRFSAHPAPSTLSSLRVRPHGQCFQRTWRPLLAAPRRTAGMGRRGAVLQRQHGRLPPQPTFAASLHLRSADVADHVAPRRSAGQARGLRDSPVPYHRPASLSPRPPYYTPGWALPHQGSSTLRAELRITAGLAAARGARHPTKIRCCDRNTFPPDCNNRLRADFVYFDEPVPPHENRVTRRSKINRVRTPINPKNGPLTAVGPGAHQFLRELPRQILFPQISLSFQFLFQHFRLPSPYSTPPPPPPTPPPPGPPCCSPSACRP